LEAVAVGDLTPAEASELGKLIEAYVKALEATDFAERLSKLERMTNRWERKKRKTCAMAPELQGISDAAEARELQPWRDNDKIVVDRSKRQLGSTQVPDPVAIQRLPRWAVE
jgi:hypothetical protein